MKITIGAHLSIAKGYLKASQEAYDMGANTFQFFSRNPRGGSIRKFDQKEADDWNSYMQEHQFGEVLAHAPYTLNMASSKEEVRDFAYRAFSEDLERLSQLPCTLYNFHPGSHTGDGVQTGVSRITEILNKTLFKEQKVIVLLETMAGKGTEIGRSFEEIAEIIAKTQLNEKLGVCLDTCHTYCAGYDIKNNLDDVLEEFDKIIGLNRLKALHLNDTKNDYQTNKDRHEILGNGFLGIETFVEIIKNKHINQLPMFLETPNDFNGYAREVAFLKGVAAALS